MSRLFFIILLVGSIPSCLTDSCNNMNDCSLGYYVCLAWSCVNCITNVDCYLQHSVRETCKSGIKKCVECSTNSDCGTGKVCVTDNNIYLCGTSVSYSTSTCSSGQSIFVPNGNGGGGFYCLACENDSDCYHWTGSGSSSCSSGKCSPAFVSCGQHSDCPSITASKCNNYVCKPCTEDSHCSQFSVTPVCNSGTCVQCKAHTDCPSASAAKCSSNICVPCTENIQCAHLSSIPACKDPGPAGTCVQCADDSDCPTAVAAKCLSNTCTTCTTSSQCAHLSSTPLCDTTNGKCVQCLSITDCTGGKICSPSGVCVACTSSTQCTISPTLLCSSTLGQCVECSADSDCNSDVTKGECSNLGTCIACTGSTHCTHFTATPVCSVATGRICVECVSDSDYLDVARAECDISSNSCTTCTNSTHCSHLTSTPVCKTPEPTRMCVQCVYDSDCPTITAAQCSTTVLQKNCLNIKYL